MLNYKTTTDMKISILAIALLVSSAVFAQSDKFADAIKKNLQMMDSAKTTEDYNTVAAQFVRIGEAEKTQWLPYYYAGLALSTNGWRDPKLDKDANAARIIEYADKAAAIKDNAELYALKNMAYTQQMLVDPQTRWQTAGKEAGEALQKGMQLDPNNPRLFFLQASGVFNTPEQFGGGKDKAKPILEKAMKLFEAEKPQPLYPHWGKQQTADMLAQIK
jgi:hypothetical protein